MTALKLDLDTETLTKLIESALRERRPTAWQAEILLRKALGLPFPLPLDDAYSAVPEHVYKERHADEPPAVE